MVRQKGIASTIVLIIVLVGVIVGVIVVQNYTSFLPKASSYGAVLSLVPSSVNTGISCQFDLSIHLDTGGFSTDGTDALLKFDPMVLEVVEVQKGDIYSIYPGNTINNETGTVVVSGLATPSTPYSGSGKLATLKFKVKPNTNQTQTNINFNFDPLNPYKTNDTNVVETSTIAEILREVVDAQINIASDTNCSGETEPEVKPPTITLKTDPNSRDSRKAIIEWSDIIAPKPLDRIEVYYASLSNPQTKLLTDWIYPTTCSRSLPGALEPKSSGTCPINLPKQKAYYEVRYMQNLATSKTLQLSK